MATYTITVNERTKTGKNLVELLRSMKDVVSIDTKLSGIEESIEDIKKGRVYKAKNADDLFKQCL